jgi:hypothetical protein
MSVWVVLMFFIGGRSRAATWLPGRLSRSQALCTDHHQPRDRDGNAARRHLGGVVQVVGSFSTRILLCPCSVVGSPKQLEKSSEGDSKLLLLLFLFLNTTRHEKFSRRNPVSSSTPPLLLPHILNFRLAIQERCLQLCCFDCQRSLVRGPKLLNPHQDNSNPLRSALTIVVFCREKFSRRLLI